MALIPFIPTSTLKVNLIIFVWNLIYFVKLFFNIGGFGNDVKYITKVPWPSSQPKSNLLGVL